MKLRLISGALALVALAGTTSAAISLGGITTLPAPTRPSGVTTGDFNGDTAADIAVTTDDQDKITIYFGNGAGGFSGPVNFLTGNGSGPEDIAAADFDGDGDTDLIVVLQNINTIRVFTNAGGVFTAGVSATVGNEARGMAAGDIDGDGDTDFVVANRNGNTATIIRDMGTTLATTTVATGAEPRAVAIGQFAGDSLADLAITNHDDRSISILRGTGNGTFAPFTTLSVGSSVRPEGIAAGDLDNDGDSDIAAATSSDGGQNFIAVFINNGGTFAGPVNYATGGVNPGPVILTDLDAATGNEDSANISVFSNNGAGILGDRLIVGVGATPEHLAAGNFSGPTTAELVVSNRDGNTLSVIANLTEPACIADFDNSGFVDTDDFDAFVHAFEAGTSNADVDQSGFVDTDDFDFFVHRFEAGC